MIKIKKTSYFITILLMGVVGFFLYNQPAKLTDKEKTVMDSLFKNTKQQCIGRYVFDVPFSFENKQHAAVMIDKYRIETKRIYFPAFEQMIHLREKELKTTETVKPRDMPFLKNSIVLGDDLNGVIFDRNEDVSIPGYARILEAYLYNNGVAFTVTKKFDDLSDEKYSKDKTEYFDLGFSDKSFTSALVQINEMKEFLTTLSGRQDADIPSVPGSCIPDGFIRDSEKINERMGLLYETDFNIDLAIVTNNFLRAKNSMLERTGGVSTVLSKINGHIIKHESSLIHGIKMDELLTIGEKKNGPGELYQFMLMGNEKNADFMHPIISISLDNYGVKESLLSEAQVIDLWNRITRTIRIRPGAF